MWTKASNKRRRGRWGYKAITHRYERRMARREILEQQAA
jgi:hypothetical protein